MTTFIPSPEQQAIIDAFKNDPYNIAVEAMAGTGKTATIVALAREIKAESLYVAHNRDIAADVQPKLAGTQMTSKTLHSAGNGALKKALPGAQPDGDKYTKLARAWVYPNEQDARAELNEMIVEMLPSVPDEERGDFGFEFLRGFSKSIRTISDWVRYKLVEPTDALAITELIGKYGLDEDLLGLCPDDRYLPILVGAAQSCLTEGERMAKEEKKIDFTDQIYLVIKWGLKPYSYKYVFIDEAQDLSPMQRALVSKLVWSNGGRVVVVGDPRQAIYAFAGADADSFDLSVKAFNCTVFPLTVTRRCQQIIVHHVKQLVPGYQALDTAPRGKVIWWKEDKLADVVKPDDMVICRLKAPLVGTMFSLVAAGHAVSLLGVDVAKIVNALIDRLEKRNGFNFETIETHLKKYTMEQYQRFMKKGDESRAGDALDNQDLLLMLLEKSNAKSLEGLRNFIETFFSSSGGKGKVILCTAHKSKGLEADRVFLLSPDKLPLNHPKATAASRQQELNLAYVAQTRAKKVLVYLTNEKFLYPMGPQAPRRVMPPYVQETFDDLEWKVEDLTAPIDAPALPAPVVVDEQPAEQIEEAVIVEDQPAIDYTAAPPSNLEMLTEPDIEFTDDDFGDDEEMDAPMLTFANGQPVPEVAGLTWDTLTAKYLNVPSSEQPLAKLKALSLEDEPVEEPAAQTIEPIVIPMPPIRATRDHQAVLKRELAAKELTAKRQSLVDLVMGLDAAQIDALMGVLQHVKELRTMPPLPANVVALNGHGASPQ